MTNPSSVQNGSSGKELDQMVRLCETRSVRLETIHTLLSFATYYNMRLHQIDVKCAFLNDTINEEVLRTLYGHKQTLVLGMKN
ncbi:hypothetical protein CR513_17899, partial [Mucuna pruriens]